MLSPKIIILMLFALITKEIIAQNFNYSLEKDSSEYTSLSSPTLISSNESWTNKQFKLHLPFQFNFCGVLTDSVFIESNGFIIFDKTSQISVVAFNEFGNKRNSQNNFMASLSYEVVGSDQNRILKIQFQNLSKSVYSSTDNLSYQVWLFENGNKIEIHVGPHSFLPSGENTNALLLGLINPKMDSSPVAYLIEGTIHSSFGKAVNAGEDLIYLNDIPFEGNVFRLIPLF